jgi:hypothetical protein
MYTRAALRSALPKKVSRVLIFYYEKFNDKRGKLAGNRHAVEDTQANGYELDEWSG